MPRRRAEKENIRNLQRTRGSYHVSLPVGIMRSLGWKERQKVVVRKYGLGKILISDWKKK